MLLQCNMPAIMTIEMLNKKAKKNTYSENMARGDE